MKAGENKYRSITNEHRSYCTVRQLEVLEAYEANDCNIEATARALGFHRKSVTDALDAVLRKAALQGLSPVEDAKGLAPETHIVRGKSMHYTEGKLDQVWVKTHVKAEEILAQIKDAISAFLMDVPQLPIAPAPLDVQTEIVPWIQIGDAHLGMLAHLAETNENFDLKIAERELLAAIFQLVDEMPPCERLVINDLGDFTHYENMAGETEASGHKLDYDGRFPRMIVVYSRVMRAIVERALTKAQHVDVIVNQGNHSRTNDIWMAELLRVAYGHTGRVHVLDNHSVFIPYRMGKTLVMVHHGDQCPPARLIGVMTTDFRKDYGETEFHYIDQGHVHHKFVTKEHSGAVIESWNNLAPNDKWHHEAGYRSRKSITVVLRSRLFGEVGRRVLSIEEVQARLEARGGMAIKTKEVYTV
jgi:hypothetical protein